MLAVTDDSGFLALVVPASYVSFVAEDWQFERLRGHFQHQMAQRSLLIWATGAEGCWRVDVRIGESRIRGFREVTGPLHVTGGALLVTNYESLTMAAQFEDVRLPERYQQDLVVALPDGHYSCRIVQLFDPDKEPAGQGDADFLVSIHQPTRLPAPWPDIPWFRPQ